MIQHWSVPKHCIGILAKTRELILWYVEEEKHLWLTKQTLCKKEWIKPNWWCKPKKYRESNKCIRENIRVRKQNSKHNGDCEQKVDGIEEKIAVNKIWCEEVKKLKPETIINFY